MATPAALEALSRTEHGLKEIKKRLQPFLQLLTTTSSSSTATSSDSAAAPPLHVRAQAQAVVALSMGTLRYMGARLRGLDQGRKADDPLRQELNHMRKVLVEVEKLKPKNVKDAEGKETAKPAPIKEEEAESKVENMETTESSTQDVKEATMANITVKTPAATVAADGVSATPASSSRVDKVVAQRLVQAALKPDNVEESPAIKQEAKQQQQKQAPKRGRETAPNATSNSRSKSNDRRNSKTNAKKQRKSR